MLSSGIPRVIPKVDDESIEKRGAKRAEKNFLEGVAALDFVAGYAEMQKELRDNHASWRDCNHHDHDEGACDHTDEQALHRYWDEFLSDQETEARERSLAWHDHRDDGEHEAIVFYRRKVMGCSNADVGLVASDENSLDLDDPGVQVDVSAT